MEAKAARKAKADVVSKVVHHAKESAEGNIDYAGGAYIGAACFTVCMRITGASYLVDSCNGKIRFAFLAADVAVGMVNAEATQADRSIPVLVCCRSCTGCDCISGYGLYSHVCHHRTTRGDIQ